MGIVVFNAFWSTVAAAGFAILFNVPRRLLWGCMLTGAAGHALRTFLVEALDMQLALATFFGAGLVGFISQWLARRLHTPAPIFAVSGTIPMVPGLFAYSAMIAIIQATTAPPDVVGGLLTKGATDAVQVLLILGAIATGIVLPILLFEREKPVV